jgi:REP element-mobilizing transposase RayT
LAEAATRFHWLVHAYTVMSNHFHLAVELGEPNLSDGMQWLQGTWIRRFNAYRHLVGRPFQGRYKALLVEPGEGFGRVCDYIHLNPVRAGLVTIARLPSYLPGSLPKFVRGSRPAWLVPATVLAHSGNLTDTPAGWQATSRASRSSRRTGLRKECSRPAS